MSRIVGYRRPLRIDDGTDERATLREAGATKVVIAAASADHRSDTSLRDLISDLRTGDTLLVTRTAHLAPSVARYVSVFAELQSRGIRFRSLAEPALSTAGDVSVTPDDVVLAIEALRRELIGLRTREGLQDAARNGRRPGRPSVMTPDRISMARELRAGGRPISHIARVIGVSPNAVRRALESESSWGAGDRSGMPPRG